MATIIGWGLWSLFFFPLGRTRASFTGLRPARRPTAKKRFYRGSRWLHRLLLLAFSRSKGGVPTPSSRVALSLSPQFAFDCFVSCSIHPAFLVLQPLLHSVPRAQPTPIRFALFWFLGHSTFFHPIDLFGHLCSSALHLFEIFLALAPLFRVPDAAERPGCVQAPTPPIRFAGFPQFVLGILFVVLRWLNWRVEEAPVSYRSAFGRFLSKFLVHANNFNKHGETPENLPLGMLGFSLRSVCLTHLKS